MQCLGRTKTAQRCKLGVSGIYPFCHHHRWQPWAAALAVITTIGLFAGLYRDVIQPLLESDEVKQQRADMRELCAAVHGVIESTEGMSREIDIREGFGRSATHNVFDDQMARVINYANRVADPKLVSAATTSRSLFYQLFALPDGARDDTVTPRRLDLALAAYRHLVVIVEACKAKGLYNFPAANDPDAAYVEPFSRSWTALVGLLRSEAAGPPLELTDSVLVAQNLIAQGGIATGVRRQLRACCSSTPKCELLARTPGQCNGVSERFIVIQAEEYYLGGHVLTLMFAEAPNRVMFVWWKPQSGGIVMVRDASLTPSDHAKLKRYYAELLEYARKQ